MVNLANLHQQQQGNAPANQNDQANEEGENSNNSLVNQAPMDENLFTPGTGIERIIVLEEHESATLTNEVLTEKEDQSVDGLAVQSGQEKRKQTICAEDNLLNSNIIPELTQILVNGLKPLLFNLTQRQSYGLKQSIIFEAPKIKLHMVGSNINSVQIITDTEKQPLDTIIGSKLINEDFRRILGVDNGCGHFAYSKHPIKHFYVRPGKECSGAHFQYTCQQ